MSMDAARTGAAGAYPSAPFQHPAGPIFPATEEPAEGRSSSATAADETGRPAWFQKPATRNPAAMPTDTVNRPVRKKLRLETSNDDEEPQSWSKTVKSWILGAAGLSYGISILFHAALLILMAVIVYHSLPDDERGTIMMDTRDEDEISLAEVDTRVDLPIAKEDLAPPQLQAVPLPEVDDADLQLQADLNDVLPALGAAGEGTGGGTGLALPRGTNAVTKGSFTAWTVPEDPEPARDYAIVIEVKVPDRIKTYRLVDLTGVVIGTDLYTQQIPFDPRNPSSTLAVRDGKPVTLRDTRASVPIVDGRVQLLIRVPGAAQLVKDTIKIRSRLLKEDQELEIEF